MSALEAATSPLDPALAAITRGGGLPAYRADPEAFLARFRLTESEQSALRAADFERMYDMGAHPMLLLYLSRALGLGLPDYLAAIGPGHSDQLQTGGADGVA